MTELTLPAPLTIDDEGRHPPDPGVELWNESWYLDFASHDGSFGGYVRVAFTPNFGSANVWGCAVGDGRPLVTALRHHVPLPSDPDTLDVDGAGVAVRQVVESPFSEFSVRLDANAVALEDPIGVYTGAAGDPVALAIDLTWRSASGPFPYPGMTRYEIPCLVTGTVQMGGETVSVDGQGERDHSWGRRDWWEMGWCWTSGRLDDDTWFHGMRPAVEAFDYEPGFVRRPGSDELVVADRCKPRYEWGPDGLPVGTGVALHDLDLETTPLRFSPVRLDHPDGRVARLARALCRYEDRPTARIGYGWTEWNLPPGGQV